jgi:uncharacterized protein YqcC (DUF446 family)
MSQEMSSARDDQVGLALAKIREIEAELKRLGRWSSVSPTREQLDGMGPFGMGTMTFCAWIQFVLIPRVREISEKGGKFPAESNVGAHAVREFDGDIDADRLVELLIEFDSIFEAPDPP